MESQPAETQARTVRRYCEEIKKMCANTLKSLASPNSDPPVFAP